MHCQRPSYPSLLPLIGAVIAIGGCEMRDEEAPGGSAAWAPAVAERFTAAERSREPQAAASGRLECVEGFAAGSRRAADAGLPLLLVFRASWCPWSDQFLATAVADARLVAASDRFVCASVDADRDAATCRSFGVRAFPTIVALDATRRERFRATGASARERLPKALAAMIADPPPRLAADPPASPR